MISGGSNFIDFPGLTTYFDIEVKMLILYSYIGGHQHPCIALHYSRDTSVPVSLKTRLQLGSRLNRVTYIYY